jgi:hypothetical protein
MLYRYEILTNDGTYEGYAHSEGGMSKKFRDQTGLRESQFQIFVSFAPENMTLDQYRALDAAGLSEHTIRLLGHSFNFERLCSLVNSDELTSIFMDLKGVLHDREGQITDR